ncbi:hypothetical protein [Bradyrhizobium sp. BR13661]|jgi:hypothetical protein|nr:hypothetical protein [Bradyrhizobium sp. BR13661]
MISILILVAAITAVALTERSEEHLPFAVAALLFNADLLLVFLGDAERAILLSGLFAVAIAGISSVKFHHSALKLTVSDLPLAFAGTVPFFVLFGETRAGEGANLPSRHMRPDLITL